ncbi:MAG: Ppx/GppA family phosphatase [Bosea sp.]|jgi:exopolyphosphatase/guanosine-5'-triphosphate,3'-diphosphate pyrophosphatase|nr:Ppx/GppA family phosphatase [Bosea sp. (in: a-proteobacteria)]
MDDRPPPGAPLASGKGQALEVPALAPAPALASELYAALDLGTNNCRLLIAQPALHGFRVVDAFSRIVRLGEGLAANGRLGEAAMERALEALAACSAKMKLRGVTRSRLVTTEACRAAGNGREFVARVASETGLLLEVVDQRTEAMLAVTGCAALVSPDADAVIVFDIGGGSTEIVWLGGRSSGRSPEERIQTWESIPMGVVLLAERHGGVEVGPELFESMVAEATAALAKFHKRARPAMSRRGFHLLGTSGTVTTVAGLHLRLDRYDRRKVDGLWMRTEDVSTVMDELLAMDFEARAANPCIGRERADLVLAGCAIFEAIRRLFPSPKVRIADRGLREGILLKMMFEDGVWRRRRSS